MIHERVAILQDDLPGFSREATATMAATFRDAGFGVAELGIRDLLSWRNERRGPDLLLLHACALPRAAKDAIGRYLERGGRLFVFGGRLFQDLAWKYDGRWINRAQRDALLGRVDIHRSVFAPRGLLKSCGWEWLTDTADHAIGMAGDGRAAFDRRVTAPGYEQSLRLDAEINRDHHGCVLSCICDQPFRDGDGLTCIWAKGDRHTTQVAVSWKERDGSLWTKPLALTTEWQYHVIPADAFAHRSGGAGDRGGVKNVFQPKAAIAFRVELGVVGCPKTRLGPNTVWLGEI